jgi:WD40 repeat protein
METYAVAALPDLSKILVGQPLGVGMLDVDAGRVIRPLRGDAASTCYAMAASADGRQVVVGGGTTARKDCHARLFDVETGQQLARSDELPSSVTKVTRSADGRRAFLQCSNQLFVWDMDRPAVRKLVQVSGQLRDAILMPDGRKALMCFSGIACLWDVNADQQAQEIARFPSIDRVAVSPDGKFALLLCSGPRMPPKAPDQSLQLVDLTSGQTVRTLENIPNHIRDVAFMGDAKRAVSIGTDRTLRAWDLNPALPPGNPAPANPGPSNPPPATGKGLWRLDTPLGTLARLAVSPDGQRLLVTLSGHALFADAATGKVLRRLDGPLGAYQWVAFLPDNKRALIVSNSRLVRLWDVEKGQILREDAIPGAEGLALTPDGRRYFVGGRDRVLLALDVETGKELLRLEGHRSQVRTVSASPDGRWVLSTGEIDFLWWDAETGKELGRGQGAGFVRGAAIAPDSRRFALGNQNTIRIWDREAGKEIGQLAGLASDAMSIAWLPDGRHLVAASGTSSLVNGKPVYRDSVVRLFDVQAARLLATFAGHDKHAWDLRVSPDGRRAFSSYMDSTVRCWDLEAALMDGAGK